jgi:hypothetical protein
VDNSGRGFRILPAPYKNDLGIEGTVNTFCIFHIFDRCVLSCNGESNAEQSMTLDPKIAAKTQQLQNEIRGAKVRTVVTRSTYSLPEDIREPLHRLSYELRATVNDMINISIEDLLLKSGFPVDLTRPTIREQLRERRGRRKK